MITAPRLSADAHPGTLTPALRALAPPVVPSFGAGSSGRLGYDDTANRGDAPNELGLNLPAISLPTATTASSVSGGYLHTCAVLSDSTVRWCVHRAAATFCLARLSRGPRACACTVTPRVPPRPPPLLACVLSSWGDNTYGQLGTGDNTDAGDGVGRAMGNTLVAANLGGSATPHEVKCGYEHTCVRTTISSVVGIQCFGRGGSGQLGSESTANANAAGSHLDFGAGLTLGTTWDVHLGDHGCVLFTDSTLKWCAPARTAVAREGGGALRPVAPWPMQR